MPDLNVNLALSLLNLQSKSEDVCNTKINEMLDKLTGLNEENRKLGKLHSALSMADKSKGKVSFKDNPEMLETVYALYELHPEIFGHELTYEWSERDIEKMLGAISHAVQSCIGKTNQQTMFIHMRFDDMNLINKSVEEVVKGLERHMESIIKRYSR
jgi:hypothetical protein